MDYRAQRRRIEKVWREWKWLLPEWDIAQRYFEGAFALANGKGTVGTIAEARANWRYLNGSVRWDLQSLADIDDTELEETVVHEMVHFLLNELNSSDDEDGDRTDHEERVTTTISRLLIRQKARS